MDGTGPHYQGQWRQPSTMTYRAKLILTEVAACLVAITTGFVAGYALGTTAQHRLVHDAFTNMNRISITATQDHCHSAQ